MGLIHKLSDPDDALAPAADVRATRRAIRAHGGVVTAGDVMAETGLGDVAAEAALKTLLRLHPAVLEVRDDGTLVYRFETTSLAKRRVERFLDGVGRFVGGTLLTVAKVAIMLTIVGYSIFFVTAAIIAAIVAIVAAEGDIFDGDGAFELLAVPFRLIAEILFWAPDWVFWGTSVEYRPPPRHENKTPVYERVFRYLFGPPAPRLREEQVVRARAQLIRAHRGVITVVDLIRATGMNRRDAEHELAMLVGRLGGDVAVTEDGEVLYLFADLVRAIRPGERPRGTVPVVFEGKRPLTGNTSGTNAIIAVLAGITLIGGVVGGALFDKFGVFGVLPQMLGAWIPIGVGALFLALPPLRALPLQRENQARIERDARRALIELHQVQGAHFRSMPNWTNAINAQLNATVEHGTLERMVRDLGTDFGADVEVRPEDEVMRYRFPALASGLAAGALARTERRLDRKIASRVAFSTADEPPRDDDPYADDG